VSSTHAPRRDLVTQPVARFFDQATAAAYLGIGARTFENEWRTGLMPGPHRIGRRLVWDRRLLDQWADVVSGIAAGLKADEEF